MLYVRLKKKLAFYMAKTKKQANGLKLYPFDFEHFIDNNCLIMEKHLANITREYPNELNIINMMTFGKNVMIQNTLMSATILLLVLSKESLTCTTGRFAF